jgi:hypothetical protein
MIRSEEKNSSIQTTSILEQSPQIKLTPCWAFAYIFTELCTQLGLPALLELPQI